MKVSNFSSPHLSFELSPFEQMFNNWNEVIKILTNIWNLTLKGELPVFLGHNDWVGCHFNNNNWNVLFLEFLTKWLESCRIGSIVDKELIDESEEKSFQDIKAVVNYGCVGYFKVTCTLIELKILNKVVWSYRIKNFVLNHIFPVKFKNINFYWFRFSFFG